MTNIVTNNKNHECKIVKILANWEFWNSVDCDVNSRLLNSIYYSKRWLL